ncbi:MAG: hypothetical protein PHE55_19405, partial [Methylococcaceae bacterium]|nr:hypothetical protein [Methylococcaceae bacterium]
MFVQQNGQTADIMIRCLVVSIALKPSRSAKPMIPWTLSHFTGAAALVAMFGSSAAGAAELAALPVHGDAKRPALLLELGSAPPLAAKDAGTRIFRGEVSAHEGDASIQIDQEEVRSLHPGFGAWNLAFRFQVKPGALANPYTFWARWKQGGEPDVCVQSFEVWAGPDRSRLERRAVLAMKPKGWDYAWIAGEQPVTLKADDAIIEVRDNGPGHDAKVFDAFLLGPPPPPPALPALGTRDKPLVLLDLGKKSAFPANGPDPVLQVRAGTAKAGAGAESLLTEKEEVQVFHPGFGDWGATFRFELKPSLPPGLYRFFARYKSGGEVSQVAQSFTVKAGAEGDPLAARGSFSLTNPTPWEYQWLQAPSTVALLPGDGWLEVENTGKADGAKVFDAFALQLEIPLGGWMNAAQAQARNRFLALTKAAPASDRRLYVLDGKGEKGEILFRGLASDSARTSVEKLPVTYLLGPKADAMAKRLNLPLPAAVMTDDHYTVLGALTRPQSEAEVTGFLAGPVQAGMMPSIAPVGRDEPKALRGGVPQAWLVGGLQDGQAGLSIFGLDGETVLRPNPGQPYLGTQMMGGEMRAWQKAPTAANGVAVI